MNYVGTHQDILTLPKEHPVIGKTFELTFFDHHHFGLYTRCGLVFPNKDGKDIDVERLKKSLLETLIEYPELTGSLKMSERVSLTHSNAGAKFSVFKSSSIDYDDLLAMKREDMEMFYASCKVDLSQEYLCHVRVSILKDKSYIMAFSISHAVQDAHSMFQFVNAWSYRYLHPELEANDFGRFTNCDFNERDLLKGHNPVDHYELYKIEKSDSHWDNSVGFKSVTMVVSKEKIKVLKEEYLELRTSADPHFISSNDVMCAIFFKAISKTKQISENTHVKFGQVKNFRKLLGLSDQFSGNASTATRFSLIASKIDSLKWWQLAAMIRSNLISLSAEKMKGILGFLDSQENWNYVKPRDDNLVDTVFVNWEMFPIYESDFGHGKPEKLLYTGWRYGLVTFLPASMNGLTEVILDFTEDELQHVINDSLVKTITV